MDFASSKSCDLKRRLPCECIKKSFTFENTIALPEYNPIIYLLRPLPCECTKKSFTFEKPLPCQCINKSFSFAKTLALPVYKQMIYNARSRKSNDCWVGLIISEIVRFEIEKTVAPPVYTHVVRLPCQFINKLFTPAIHDKLRVGSMYQRNRAIWNRKGGCPASLYTYNSIDLPVYRHMV